MAYRSAFLDGCWPRTDHLLSPDVLDVVAEHAAAADRSGDLSLAGLDAVRRSLYLGAAVPEQFEGAGASVLECAAVQRRVAMHDAGLALALNMHTFSIGMMVEHWRRERDTSWMLLEAIASQQRSVSSAFAERGLNGNILRSGFEGRAERGGYRISCVKTPCSLADQCDLICFQFEAEEDGIRKLLVALVPRTTPGVTVERTWDALGMRGSGSDTLRMKDVFVPDELVFHRCAPGFDDDDVFAAGLSWFCVTTLATYVGVLETALRHTTAHLDRSTVTYGRMRADQASVQDQVGEATGLIALITSSVFGVADRIADPTLDPRDVMPLALAAKAQAVPMIRRTIDLLCETYGAASYGSDGVLARCARDASAASFHPPTPLATKQMLGRLVLGRPFGFGLDTIDPNTTLTDEPRPDGRMEHQIPR